jgi:hypothetical protein
MSDGHEAAPSLGAFEARRDRAIGTFVGLAEAALGSRSSVVCWTLRAGWKRLPASSPSGAALQAICRLADANEGSTSRPPLQCPAWSNGQAILCRVIDSGVFQHREIATGLTDFAAPLASLISFTSL